MEKFFLVTNLFTPTRDITDTAGKNGSPSSKISFTPDASSIPGLVLSKRQLKKLNKKKANLQETVNTVNISDYEFDNLDSSVLSGKNIAKDGVDDILIYNDAISRGFNNLNYISICLKSKFAPFQE